MPENILPIKPVPWSNAKEDIHRKPVFWGTRKHIKKPRT